MFTTFVPSQLLWTSRSHGGDLGRGAAAEAAKRRGHGSHEGGAALRGALLGKAERKPWENLGKPWENPRKRWEIIEKCGFHGWKS